MRTPNIVAPGHIHQRSMISAFVVTVLLTVATLSTVVHPAGTSKDSDICDLSNISDMTICIGGNGNINIFNHPAYVSKDLGEIYIYGKNCTGMEIRPTLRHLGIQ